ncbi:hypothetical protein [Luteimonas aquatica]|uniref:hypothetical protein n=1 Tax=Luteimonas aquatica TaxID=450364 RepID=UPI001F5AB4F3|nr:hypothetical protein [Luteimonas aquatica]
MTAYRLLVIVHGLIGLIALLSFWSAALLRKGGLWHRRVGRVYLFAMAGILLTAVPIAVAIFLDKRPVAGVFLGFLSVITAAGVWNQWRSIRDRQDVARYTGPVFVGLGLLSLASGLLVLGFGLKTGTGLLAGFSLVGILGGGAQLYKRRHRTRLAARPRWWMIEHYTAVLGNGIATHIAFLAIGLPRLLPAVEGETLQALAWFGPLLVAVLAKGWLDRRWKRAPAPHAAARGAAEAGPAG